MTRHWLDGYEDCPPHGPPGRRLAGLTKQQERAVAATLREAARHAEDGADWWLSVRAAAEAFYPAGRMRPGAVNYAPDCVALAFKGCWHRGGGLADEDLDDLCHDDLALMLRWAADRYDPGLYAAHDWLDDRLRESDHAATAGQPLDLRDDRRLNLDLFILHDYRRMAAATGGWSTEAWRRLRWRCRGPSAGDARPPPDWP